MYVPLHQSVNIYLAYKLVLGLPVQHNNVYEKCHEAPTSALYPLPPTNFLSLLMFPVIVGNLCLRMTCKPVQFTRT